MSRNTPGRAKAVNTAAAACIPPVLANMSMTSPVINAQMSNAHFGISIGSKRIKNTYTYGFI